MWNLLLLKYMYNQYTQQGFCLVSLLVLRKEILHVKNDFLCLSRANELVRVVVEMRLACLTAEREREGEGSLDLGDE